MWEMYDISGQKKERSTCFLGPNATLEEVVEAFQHRNKLSTSAEIIPSSHWRVEDGDTVYGFEWVPVTIGE